MLSRSGRLKEMRVNRRITEQSWRRWGRGRWRVWTRRRRWRKKKKKSRRRNRKDGGCVDREENDSNKSTSSNRSAKCDRKHNHRMFVWQR